MNRRTFFRRAAAGLLTGVSLIYCPRNPWGLPGQPPSRVLLDAGADGQLAVDVSSFEMKLMNQVSPIKSGFGWRGPNRQRISGSLTTSDPGAIPSHLVQQIRIQSVALRDPETGLTTSIRFGRSVRLRREGSRWLFKGDEADDNGFTVSLT